MPGRKAVPRQKEVPGSKERRDRPLFHSARECNGRRLWQPKPATTVIRYKKSYITVVRYSDFCHKRLPLHRRLRRRRRLTTGGGCVGRLGGGRAAGGSYIGKPGFCFAIRGGAQRRLRVALFVPRLSGRKLFRSFRGILVVEGKNTTPSGSRGAAAFLRRAVSNLPPWLSLLQVRHST